MHSIVDSHSRRSARYTHRLTGQETRLLPICEDHFHSVIVFLILFRTHWVFSHDFLFNPKFPHLVSDFFFTCTDRVGVCSYTLISICLFGHGAAIDDHD